MIQENPNFATEQDPLPARMINEFVYCPRLFWLEHIEGLFAHNADTVEGASLHRRVDREPQALPAPESKDGQCSTAVIHARSVTLGSDRYGVIAKMDLIEAEGVHATPIDYKRGSPRELPDGSIGAWDPERVQLAIQALVLREHGYQVERGILFFFETRQRVEIPIDTQLVELTVQKIAEAREVVARGQIPPPLEDSPKCPRCSLVSICLPDETNACRRARLPIADRQQPWLFSLGAADDPAREIGIWSKTGTVRPLLTARSEQRPLYLNTQGLSVGKSGELLQIREKDRKIEEVRLHDISQVNLFGAIQVTTQAVQTLLSAEIPLVYFTMGGWFYGLTQGVGLKNILVRREQFRRADDSRFCLAVARELVLAKVKNQRTMLMRNHIQPPPHVIGYLKELQNDVSRAKSLESLLGYEGLAARAWFENFAGMIKVGRNDDPFRAPWDPDDETPEWLSFDFRGRNRRPPRDPINAMLSFGYSLLVKDLTIICSSVGLDPYLGFYHQPRAGRPALALDLMEPFRPLIVDSAVLAAINTRMVQPSHFVRAGLAVALTPEGRKAFIRAYEQRMDQLVTHPIFEYRVSYRRILEIQTRLLGRLLTGEISAYPGFVTR